MTKLMGPKRVHPVRGRGANYKFRALRLDTGNFSWGSESCTHKTKVLDVVYNATNNELVRTKTLVKNAIVLIDANPFRLWYLKKYDVELNNKKIEESDKARAAEKRSSHVKAKLRANQKDRKLEDKLATQFNGGRLLACISSRPGQSGRADGYVLEGKELEFYQRKMDKKKKV
jgi:small subunit ribosomal protein S8e